MHRWTLRVVRGRENASTVTASHEAAARTRAEARVENRAGSAPKKYPGVGFIFRVRNFDFGTANQSRLKAFAPPPEPRIMTATALVELRQGALNYKALG
jgi:hypothetical protein